MQTSEHYDLQIPESRDGLYKIIEQYKDLFHAIDRLIYDNRFVGTKFTPDMQSKLENIQYTNLAGLEFAIINLQDAYNDLVDSMKFISERETEIISNIEALDTGLAMAVNTINDIKAMLATVGGSSVLDSISTLVSLLDDNAVEILASLGNKAEQSRVHELELKVLELEERSNTFDKFGIIIDDITGAEYRVAVSAGQLILHKTESTLIDEVINSIQRIETTVTENLLLPIAMLKCEIKWVSSDTNVVLDNGIVIRPLYGEPNRSAILTATITNGIHSRNIDINVTVLPITAYEQLTIDVSGLALPSHISSSLTLPTTVGYSSVSWVSSDETYLTNQGELIKRPASHELSRTIYVTASATLDGEIQTRIFNLVILQE